MAKPQVEIPGAVSEPAVVEAAVDVIVPTEAELAMLAAMRKGHTIDPPKAPAAIIVPTADLPDAKDIDAKTITQRLLTKTGWLLPEAAQKQANG